jgi:class 3 adenylate cyclase
VLALPLAGLALLLVQPDLDTHWQHGPSHFWLVLVTALVNLALGLAASEAARRRSDARALLVSLAFIASAGFLGLHALATPGTLVDAGNTGFVIASPVGLLVAAAFAAASGLDLSPAGAGAVVRRQRVLRLGLIAVLVVWAVVSATGAPPLDHPLVAEDAEAPLYALAIAAVPLYLFAALRYLRLYRRRGDALPAAVAAAWILLAEATVAVALSRSWQLSWWEWHLLMTVAFGLVAWTARAEYRRAASLPATFAGIYLDATREHADERSSAALRELVDGISHGTPTGGALEGFSAEEAELLERAAREIVALDGLFSPYVSPQLAARLREHPELAELGGVEQEVSVLFADLQGFTAFSEGRRPAEVIAMLNRYWSGAVPATLEQGGTLERFAGDAIMVVFNVAGDQPDHALRAARAAVGLQRAAEEVAESPDWPRFRVGLNTGLAVVGNVGSAEQRSFTAIGDTTNLAARLQGLAEPGQIVLGAATQAELGEAARVEALGRIEVKGKREPVEAFVLLRLEPTSVGSGTTPERGA